jgi:pilus assembly protein CpaF
MMSPTPSPTRQETARTSPTDPDRFIPERGRADRSVRGTGLFNGGQNPPRRRIPPQFGPLSALVGDPTVTDVFVNASGEVWCDRGAGLRRVRTVHIDPTSARALSVSLVALGGRHVDESTPCADVRLADGIRVHAVLPPVSRGGALLSVRVPSIGRLSLDDLDDAGLFATVRREAVQRLVDSRANLLLTGAGGSGKTTLLGALLATADPNDRIVTLEDVAELRIDHPHVVSLEARQPNLEGAGGVDLARLVREALRMRPDRLVVGECRGAELRDLMTALNTGHDGGAGTLHANGVEAVPARLEALGALAGLSPQAVARQAVTAFDALVHLERQAGGRLVSAIGALRLDDDGRLAVTATLRP